MVTTIPNNFAKLGRKIWAAEFWLTDWLTDWLNAWQFEPLQAQEKMPRKNMQVVEAVVVVVVVVVLWCSAVAVIYPSVYRSVYLFVLLFICLSVYLSIYLSICKFENEASLRDFLNFWTWQRQKRNNSARLSQVLNLTTSKTKQFLILRDFLKFWTWQHQKRNNSARLPSKMESWVQSWRPRTNAFSDFPLHLSKVLRLPRKSGARSYEVLHLSRRIIFPKLKICWSKVQPLSGNQRPDLLTSLMNMSLVLRLPRKVHLARSSAYVPRLPSVLKLLQNLHVLLTFDKVHNPLRLPRDTTSERPKVLHTPQFFAHLTSKCASRHSGVHFFDISTSKSGPDLVCFVHFDLELCFAPQRHALFRHLTCPDLVCFVHFDFKMLRATTACNFSSLIWPAGSAPAALASLLFDPPEPQIIGKTQCFATFLPFRAPGSSFFLILSLFWYSFFFSSLTLPTCAFPSVHIVGSLTSKLPSNIYIYIYIRVWSCMCVQNCASEPLRVFDQLVLFCVDATYQNRNI